MPPPDTDNGFALQVTDVSQGLALFMQLSFKMFDS